MEITAWISLGSILGNKSAHVLEAARRLEGTGLRLVRSSSLWLTEPVDGAGPEWFVNSVVEIATPGSVSPIGFSGGRLMAAIPIATGSGDKVDLEDLDMRLDAGDIIVFSLATAKSSGDCSLGVTWRED